MSRPYQTESRLQAMIRYAMGRYTHAWMARSVRAREVHATRWFNAAVSAERRLNSVLVTAR